MFYISELKQQNKTCVPRLWPATETAPQNVGLRLQNSRNKRFISLPIVSAICCTIKTLSIHTSYPYYTSQAPCLSLSGYSKKHA